MKVEETNVVRKDHDIGYLALNSLCLHLPESGVPNTFVLVKETETKQLLFSKSIYYLQM